MGFWSGQAGKRRGSSRGLAASSRGSEKRAQGSCPRDFAPAMLRGVFAATTLELHEKTPMALDSIAEIDHTLPDVFESGFTWEILCSCPAWQSRSRQVVGFGDNT